MEQPIDPERFNAWIGVLLQEQGPGLLRTKGILSYAKSRPALRLPGGAHDRRRRFHREVEATAMPAHQPLVFIGRNLNRPQLRRGFESCVGGLGSVRDDSVMPTGRRPRDLLRRAAIVRADLVGMHGMSGYRQDQIGSP